MYFNEALEAMRDGKVVQIPGYHPIFYEDGKIKVKRTEESFRREFSVDEILSHEWNIVEEPPEVGVEINLEKVFKCPKCEKYSKYKMGLDSCPECGKRLRIVDNGVDIIDRIELKTNNMGMIYGAILR